ncbi:hypothetical protein B0J14DRAFT_312271 [Halenospora varia]|nr:hypothetical protein B0J14DRAFT_312271 [Halenospora varia]
MTIQLYPDVVTYRFHTEEALIGGPRVFSSETGIGLHHFCHGIFHSLFSYLPFAPVSSSSLLRFRINHLPLGIVHLLSFWHLFNIPPVYMYIFIALLSTLPTITSPTHPSTLRRHHNDIRHPAPKSPIKKIESASQSSSAGIWVLEVSLEGGYADARRSFSF